MALTRFSKLLILGTAAVGVFFGIKTAMDRGMIPTPSFKSVTLEKVKTITVDDTQVAPTAPVVAALPLPSRDIAAAKGPRVKAEIIAWNAQMGFLYAVGGAKTTKGSLMEKYGVNIVVERQDDYEQMQNHLFEFAKALKDGQKHPTVGAHFVGIMGDGAPSFLQAINPRLKELGDEYAAEVIASFGYSRGEDKMMGPQEWKDNPQAARGGVCAGVLRDGDWDIAMKWLSDNGVPNNPNETTYDPNALNWVATKDFVDAGQKYIAGYTEKRSVVKDGRKTGDTKEIGVDCVVTWTPGDVTIARKKGGIVSIVSTKEYSGQMPHALIGIKKWNKENRKIVEDMIAAAHEGAAQVLSSDTALAHAGRISAEVYKEEDGAYWVKYYKGTSEKDKTGVVVELGGSKTNTLADTLYLFGISSGSDNIFAATYNTFGKIQSMQYPKFMPTFPPISEALNTSYVKAVAARSPEVASAPVEAPSFKGTVGVGDRVSTRSWTINFQTGSASFTPETVSTLEELKEGLLVAGSLAVEIHGHTDDVGDAEYNRKLSQERAMAVRNWLNSQSAKNFPIDRFRVVGHGEDAPKVANTSAANRAVNRRVDVILGTAAR